VVWVARAVAALDLAPEDITAVNEVLIRLRTRLGPGRSAVVARAPDVVTSAHLFKALARHNVAREVELFYELDAAVRWLSLRDEE
jgi:hypothetical protein